MKSDHDTAEEAAPVVSVRKLLPPEFWEEGDDDDDSPDNSKTFWQTWGSFIIVSIVVGLILLAFLLVILLCPVKAWVTAARAWKDEHYTLLCLIYIPTVVAAIMLLLPSSPFELFGVILLGPWIGFGLNVTANLAAAAASFPLGRALLSGWVKRTVRQSRVMLVLARSIHTHPLRAMLVVRFLYITSGLKNYLIAAIPNVSFLAYMLVALVHALVHDAITSAIGAVADNVIMKWTGSPLQITLLCVSIVAFILFMVLVYLAAQTLIADMEAEQQRIIAEWRAQRKEGGASSGNGEDGSDASSSSSSADDQLRHRSSGETQLLLSS